MVQAAQENAQKSQNLLYHISLIPMLEHPLILLFRLPSVGQSSFYEGAEVEKDIFLPDGTSNLGHHVLDLDGTFHQGHDVQGGTLLCPYNFRIRILTFMLRMTVYGPSFPDCKFYPSTQK